VGYRITHLGQSRKPQDVFCDLSSLAAVVGASEGADQNVLKDGQASERLHYLKRSADSGERDLVRLLAGDIATLEQDATASGLVKTGYQVEHGRFPGAIRTYDADSLTLIHAESERIHRRDSAKTFCKVFDFEKRQWRSPL